MESYGIVVNISIYLLSTFLQGVCSKLQTLKLVGNESFKEIWDGQISNISECELKEVEIESFSKLEHIFPSSMLPTLYKKLESLDLRKCISLVTVFQMKENDPNKFENLTTVTLKDCDSLEKLLLPCSYPSLTKIDISNCKSLKEIINDKERKGECFPQLKSIILENLPALSSFSLEISEFPKLQKVRIVKCPAIKTFSRSVSAEANDSKDKVYIYIPPVLIIKSLTFWKKLRLQKLITLNCL